MNLANRLRYSNKRTITSRELKDKYHDTPIPEGEDKLHEYRTRARWFVADNANADVVIIYGTHRCMVSHHTRLSLFKSKGHYWNEHILNGSTIIYYRHPGELCNFVKRARVHCDANGSILSSFVYRTDDPDVLQVVTVDPTRINEPALEMFHVTSTLCNVYINALARQQNWTGVVTVSYDEDYHELFFLALNRDYAFHGCEIQLIAVPIYAPRNIAIACQPRIGGRAKACLSSYDPIPGRGNAQINKQGTPMYGACGRRFRVHSGIIETSHPVKDEVITVDADWGQMTPRITWGHDATIFQSATISDYMVVFFEDTANFHKVATPRVMPHVTLTNVNSVLVGRNFYTVTRTAHEVICVRKYDLDGIKKYTSMDALAERHYPIFMISGRMFLYFDDHLFEFHLNKLSVVY